jgi:MoxR-like ATPase
MSGKAGSINYIPRLYYDLSDVEILCRAIQGQKNSLLLGPRGTGKNSLVEQVAISLGRPFVYIPCHSGASAETLIGQWIPNQKAGGAPYVWMDGIVTDAVRRGKIVMLDEVNALRPDVAFVIHGLLDNRRELVLTEKPDKNGSPEIVTAHDDFGLVAAGNPNYEGTRQMNEAFRDRFPVQLQMGAVAELDKVVIEEFGSGQGLEAYEIDAHKLFVEKVHAANRSGAVYSDVSTRAFVDLVSNNVDFDFKVARTMFLTRFDDSNEVTALRTCFRDVWDDDGVPLAGAPKGGAKKKTKKGGRAGRYNNKTGAKDTQDAASDA